MSRLGDKMRSLVFRTDSRSLEFFLGLWGVVTGSAFAVAGARIGSESAQAGLALLGLIFGAAQTFSVASGNLRARHVTNAVGCGYAIANIVRTVEVSILATATYSLLASAAAWCWARTTYEGQARG